MYIYNADVYCDACGEAIREELDNEGKRPEDRSDESSYDSGEYPKGPYDDSQEADSPQHCGNHEHCLEATILPSGRKVGCFLQNDLTDAGVDYVFEAIQDGGEVAELWGNYYSDHYNAIRDIMSKDEIALTKSELMDIANSVRVYGDDATKLVVIENDVYEMSDNAHLPNGVCTYLGSKEQYQRNIEQAPDGMLTTDMMRKIMEIILADFNE